MDELERFSRLVLGIQEAALAPDQWNRVVSAIVAEAGGSEGILFTPFLPPSAGGLWASRTLPASSMEHYAAYYMNKDIWRLSVPPNLDHSGSAYSDAQFLSQREMQSSEFYNDFLRQLGIGRLLCTILFSGQRPSDVHLSIFRPLERGAFDGGQVGWLRRLVPHLQNAIVTQQTLSARGDALATDEAALHSLRTPTMIVEADGTLRFANAAAERLLCASDGLRVAQRRLFGCTNTATRELHNFLATLLKPADGLPLPGAVRLARSSRRRALVCFGQALPGNRPFAGLSPTRKAVLFVRDPEDVGGMEPALLRRLHDLSAAEAELAALLVTGLGLREAALRRGVSYDTARTQLKSVLMKTGCKKQAELVALLRGEHPI